MILDVSMFSLYIVYSPKRVISTAVERASKRGKKVIFPTFPQDHHSLHLRVEALYLIKINNKKGFKKLLLISKITILITAEFTTIKIYTGEDL